MIEAVRSPGWPARGNVIHERVVESTTTLPRIAHIVRRRARPSASVRRCSAPHCQSALSVFVDVRGRRKVYCVRAFSEPRILVYDVERDRRLPNWLLDDLGLLSRPSGSRNPDASRQVRCVSSRISLLHTKNRVHPDGLARRRTTANGAGCGDGHGSAVAGRTGVAQVPDEANSPAVYSDLLLCQEFKMWGLTQRSVGQHVLGPDR